MKRLYVVLAVVMAALVLSVSLYSALTYSKSLVKSPSTTPEATTSSAASGSSITITDDTGYTVTIPVPVHRIVSLDDGHTEILCALGAENLIVGRDTYSLFPPSIKDVTDVGEYTGMSLETIIALKPDIVLADTVGLDPEVEQLRRATNIPVIYQDTANNSEIIPTIRLMGELVGNETGATTLINWCNYYINLVNSRIGTLSSSQMPTFYFGNNEEGLIFSSGPTGANSELGRLGDEAGGVDIVNSSYNGIVSPEFVVQQNPSFIFSLQYSLDGAPTNDVKYQNAISGIDDETGYAKITAVQENQVYCYDYTIVQGLRFPIGLLYFAKCFHPALFADIDPAAILANMTEEFFGIPPPGIYMYPAPT